MNITPNEISNKDFKKVFRGYDMDEVDEFLDQLVEDYEKLYKENINLKDNVSVLEEKIIHYSNIEATLQNTLLLAQTTADQVKENSKKEIEILLKDANTDAVNIVKKADEKVIEVNKEYEKIKYDYITFRTRFKALLEAQINSLEKTDIEIRE
jgi:cell division initiation protein